MDARTTCSKISWGASFGGKLVSGIKRHIAVDTNGLPHAIHVTTANVTDRAGASAAFAAYKYELPGVRNVLFDGGSAGEPFLRGRSRSVEGKGRSCQPERASQF
jgi:hypothetical protein